MLIAAVKLHANAYLKQMQNSTTNYRASICIVVKMSYLRGYASLALCR